MAGTITHVWNGTILTITTDSGTTSADLQGPKGDMGIRGPQGAPGSTTTADLAPYATKAYVDEQIKNVKPDASDVEVDLSDYYTKSETDAKIQTAVGAIPSVDLTGYATEEFVQEKIDNLLADEPDLSGLATKEYVDGAINVVEDKVYELASTVEDNVAHLIYLDGNLASNYYGKSEIDDKIKNLTGNDINMAGYATETYVQQQIQAIPQTDLTGYATEDYVQEQTQSLQDYVIGKYATQNYVKSEIAAAQLSGGSGSGSVDLSGYATKDYVDDAIDDIGISNYATKSYVLQKIDKIDIPETDLSNYYTKAQVDAKIPSTAGLATQTYVQEQIQRIPAPDLSDYYTKEETDEALAKVEVAIDNTTIIKEGGVLKAIYGGSKTPYTYITYYSGSNTTGWKANDSLTNLERTYIDLTGSSAPDMVGLEAAFSPNNFVYKTYRMVYSSTATEGKKVTVEGYVNREVVTEGGTNSNTYTRYQLDNFPTSDPSYYKAYFNSVGGVARIATNSWMFTVSDFTIYEFSVYEYSPGYKYTHIDSGFIDTGYIATRDYVRNAVNSVSQTMTVDNGNGNISMACAAVIASDTAGDGNIVLGGIN